MKPMPAPSRGSRKMLRWLAIFAAAAGGTGVLMSVPPFSLLLYPIYPLVHRLHGWLGLAVAAPLLLAILGHGLPAWLAKGSPVWMRSGIVFAAGFAAALASGLYMGRSAVASPAILLVHVGGGLLALAGALIHGAASRKP